MQCSQSSKALLCYTVDRQLMNVNPLLTKSNQTFGRHNGEKLGSIPNFKFLRSKTKQKNRKKLVIGYHVPLLFPPWLNAKMIVSLSKQPGRRKTIPGVVQDIDCFNMVVVFNI